MTEAVLATFSEVRFVKTRSTMQIVCEIPIEQADEALKALGGIPQPGTERWVGLALAPKERKEIGGIAQKVEKVNHTGLKPVAEQLEDAGSSPAASPKVHRPFNTLPLSQQAGIRSNDEQFGLFVAETDQDWLSGAANFIRFNCGVMSRAELDTNHIAAQKWLKLEEKYQALLTDLRYAGTARL